ncbi:hypothetical protein MPNT_110029 [Candidatus Methylacidithermus pantelleriae]|uniref:Uncharacterized protein n=1 Tax=Candidatus Methylacidithermus pantelleriae TaxID=2744239 RepID=A0A8J2BL26_9BACT|nr:hypothetical protein MPNT_110029 [Candidatus Methylacidithermus pantelleriae]
MEGRGLRTSGSDRLFDWVFERECIEVSWHPSESSFWRDWVNCMALQKPVARGLRTIIAAMATVAGRYSGQRLMEGHKKFGNGSQSSR